MLFAGLGSVRIVKTCDLGGENAALGMRPRSAFSSPRSQLAICGVGHPLTIISWFNKVVVVVVVVTVFPHKDLPAGK